MKVKKGEKGYLNYLKKKDIIFIIFVALISIAIFAFGLYFYKTRANIATVFAVLLLLPACKRIVNLIVLLPFRQIKDEELDRIEALLTDNVLSYIDPVFSSEKYIMKFEHLTVTGNGLFAYSHMSNEKNQYAKEYLSDGLKKRMIPGKVKIYVTLGDYEHFLKSYDYKGEFTNEEAGDYFKSLMM